MAAEGQVGDKHNPGSTGSGFSGATNKDKNKAAGKPAGKPSASARLKAGAAVANKAVANAKKKDSPKKK